MGGIREGICKQDDIAAAAGSMRKRILRGGGGGEGVEGQRFLLRSGIARSALPSPLDWQAGSVKCTSTLYSTFKFSSFNVLYKEMPVINKFE